MIKNVVCDDFPEKLLKSAKKMKRHMDWLFKRIEFTLAFINEKGLLEEYVEYIEKVHPQNQEKWKGKVKSHKRKKKGGSRKVVDVKEYEREEKMKK